MREVDGHRQQGNGPVSYKLGARISHTLEDLRRWTDIWRPGRRPDRAKQPLDEELLKPKPR